MLCYCFFVFLTDGCISIVWTHCKCCMLHLWSLVACWHSSCLLYLFGHAIFCTSIWNNIQVKVNKHTYLLQLVTDVYLYVVLAFSNTKPHSLQPKLIAVRVACHMWLLLDPFRTPPLLSLPPHIHVCCLLLILACRWLSVNMLKINVVCDCYLRHCVIITQCSWSQMVKLCLDKLTKKPQESVEFSWIVATPTLQLYIVQAPAPHFSLQQSHIKWHTIFKTWSVQRCFTLIVF